MTYAAMLLFFRNETGFGGNNGFTDFKRIAGYAVAAPETRAALFVLTFLALLAGFVASLHRHVEAGPRDAPPCGMPRCA